MGRLKYQRSLRTDAWNHPSVARSKQRSWRSDSSTCFFFVFDQNRIRPETCCTSSSPWTHLGVRSTSRFETLAQTCQPPHGDPSAIRRFRSPEGSSMVSPCPRNSVIREKPPAAVSMVPTAGFRWPPFRASKQADPTNLPVGLANAAQPNGSKPCPWASSLCQSLLPRFGGGRLIVGQPIQDAAERTRPSANACRLSDEMPLYLLYDQLQRFPSVLHAALQFLIFDMAHSGRCQMPAASSIPSLTVAHHARLKHSRGSTPR